MIRNIIGIIVGIVAGSIVNMAFIGVGPSVIPLPPGADNSSMEALTATIHLFEPKHYIFPFLAHAFGSLVGTFVAILIAVSHKWRIAVGLAAFFLLGGIAAVIMIPAPLWFDAVDLTFAYIPMALLGAKLGGAGKTAA